MGFSGSVIFFGIFPPFQKIKSLYIKRHFFIRTLFQQHHYSALMLRMLRPAFHGRHIIGESVSTPPSVISPSVSPAGGGGGGREEMSGVMLRRSGLTGRTRAGWRRRREALKPSQTSLCTSPPAWRTKGTHLSNTFFTKHL